MTYSLTSQPYLLPTPAGAYNATSVPAETRLQRCITTLLGYAETPLATEDDIVRWTNIDNAQEALEFIWRMQQMGWLQALEQPRHAPQGDIEEIFARLIPTLTRGGKALISDMQGFYLCSQGFSHEVAEELSALSADLASLHMRRSGSLNRNLGLGGSSWGLIDSAGQSKLGFWPIFAGDQRFVLVIAGTPTFNRQELVDLIWVLYQRYNLPNRLSK